MKVRERLVFTAFVSLMAASWGGCKQTPEWERGKKILHYALRSKVGSLDPVRAGTQYASLAQSQVYEPLYTYEYLVRPFELRPLLAADMPRVSEDQLTYTIPIKPGILFHDDPCFEGGKGREVIAKDFEYSFKRMADRGLTPDGWWVFKDRIVGFDAFQERMDRRDPDEPFGWDDPVAGLRAVDRYTLEIELLRPLPQLLYVLSMGYTAVMPRECAEHYGVEFGNHPVGTGPFRLVSWTRGSRLVYERHPGYRDERYPTVASEELKQRGLLAPAGQRIPFLDGIVLYVFEQDQPMWLKFRVGDLDMVQVPAEYQEVVFDDELELREPFVEDGMSNYNLPLLDMIYRGFNMEHPITGQNPRGKLIRQAISLALDTSEINDAFYNGTNILYDGPIPPGLHGYEAGTLSPYRGPNLRKARQLLADAGYPNGEGLPPIQYEISNTSNVVEQSEMFTRQIKKIGIRLEINANSFPELDDKLKRKKAQMFSLAWGADYPDAENFLQLFYGPNEAPGANNFNYKNPEFDRMYRQTRTMEPSPERTAIYQRMRDIVIEDAPAFGMMARIRFYTWNKRLRNVMPSETWYRWIKYLDVDPR